MPLSQVVANIATQCCCLIQPAIFKLCIIHARSASAAVAFYLHFFHACCVSLNSWMRRDWYYLHETTSPTMCRAYRLTNSLHDVTKHMHWITSPGFGRLAITWLDKKNSAGFVPIIIERKRLKVMRYSTSSRVADNKTWQDADQQCSNCAPATFQLVSKPRIMKRVYMYFNVGVMISKC